MSTNDSLKRPTQDSDDSLAIAAPTLPPPSPAYRLSTLREPGASWAVLDIDAADGFSVLRQALCSVTPGSGWYVLLRAMNEALGELWIPADHPPASSADIVQSLRPSTARALSLRKAWAEGTSVAPLTESAIPLRPSHTVAIDEDLFADPWVIAALTPWQRTAPRGEEHDITVVIIATPNEAPPTPLLSAVDTQRYRGTRVMVVERSAAPASNTIRAVQSFPWRQPVTHIAMPSDGVAAARNAAVDACTTEFIAFCDTDQLPCPHWTEDLLRGLIHHQVDCVTGHVAPLELVHEAQVSYEQYGGHSAGLRFVPQRFDGTRLAQRAALSRASRCGSGANMAFRTDTLRSLGPFNTVLGAGTPTRSADDVDMFARLLRRRGSIEYRPSAITWRRHPASMPELVEDIRKDGVGLGAWYASLVATDPRLTADVAAVSSAGSPRSAENLPDDLAAAFTAARRQGMREGPGAYFRSRRAQ